MKKLSTIFLNNRSEEAQCRLGRSGEQHHQEQLDREKQDEMNESPVPFVTWRSLALGAFVSIGGIIFGYDTGQISGFLEMDNFKRRFGQRQLDGTYAFNNVRSGLIVSMVSKDILKTTSLN
jgi:SP family sugar:H+ symporter-like MFS transporter